MTMFLDMILGRKRVLVKANERVLALYRRGARHIRRG